MPETSQLGIVALYSRLLISRTTTADLVSSFVSADKMLVNSVLGIDILLDASSLVFFTVDKHFNPLRLFPTITCQLATTLPDYRASIDERISRDKILVKKKMPSQFRSRIVEPLQEIVKQGKRVQPKAIFIDGLGDCVGGDAQAVIWSLLFDDKQELLGVPSKAEARDIDNVKIVTEGQYSKLVNVKAHHLVVRRCKKPLLSPQDDSELQKHHLKINSGNKEQVVKLANGAEIADLELGEDEVLLVQVPGAIWNSSFFSCSQACPLDLCSKKQKLEEEGTPSIKYCKTFQFFLHDQAC